VARQWEEAPQVCPHITIECVVLTVVKAVGVPPIRSVTPHAVRVGVSPIQSATPYADFVQSMPASQQGRSVPSAALADSVGHVSLSSFTPVFIPLRKAGESRGTHTTRQRDRSIVLETLKSWRDIKGILKYGQPTTNVPGPGSP
jgi:hypothetical protein